MAGLDPAIHVIGCATERQFMSATTSDKALTSAAVQTATPKAPSAANAPFFPPVSNSAEFSRAIWRAHPEEDTPYETVLSDAYWAHRAREFRAGHKIEVLPDEMNYYAELLVMAAGVNWVRVIELLKVELKPAAVPRRQSEYSVAWRGPHRKFAIVRASDGAIVKDRFEKEHEAEAAIPPVCAEGGWLVGSCCAARRRRISTHCCAIRCLAGVRALVGEIGGEIIAVGGLAYQTDGAVIALSYKPVKTRVFIRCRCTAPRG